MLFVALDVETTGLDPSYDQILEIAAVKVQGGAILDEFATLVYVDRTIPLQARRINGISNEMLVGQPRIDDAMRQLLHFATGGALVEHSNRAFDLLFLDRAYGSRLPHPAVNTCTLSRRLFPHLPSHSLKECCRRFRIDNAQAHRALSDARATATLLIRLLELCGSRYHSLDQLLRVAGVQR